MNQMFDPTRPDMLRSDLAAAPRRLLIDGAFHDAATGAVLDVIDPATGAVFAHAAAGGAEDIDRAVMAARRAFDDGRWTGTTPAQRQNLLLKLADLIERDAEELALLESMDNGMPFMMARFGGAMGAAGMLRYFAGWATKVTGETIEPSWPGEWLGYTRREPVGVVAAITPWNFPLAMEVGKLSAALAAGCTLVLKPAEQTPLSAVKLGELVCEAGFPDGVVNIVTGTGTEAGAPLVTHPGVDKVSFTGSTVVGQQILRESAATMKRVTLELGGKSPTFILSDADLARAIPAAAQGIFGNAGQVCAAGSRLFVHESVFDRVLEGIVERAQSLRVGAGLEPGTEMGPLVSAVQRDRVQGYIEAGRRAGVSLMTGGGTIGTEGYFIEPTVLIEPGADLSVTREEIFGPVLCAMRFGDDDIDALAARGNDTQYGLSSAIWTRDITAAHKLANRLKAGTVRINGSGPPDPALPLGGYKASGLGRENGRAGLEVFTELKTVTVSLN
ncbi:aldehyde dehydrogenase family protein [uncultured Maritimibacter sp.]|jgi:acyl-CoA reductase-like NAD-dependent aldehyde dehydrogenase|uniref:aldehyde dehydrogenase family protein n=1 Tax=uncultured Maritimibacter sp. TaxID=991866 RepID=UPI000B311677|nr:aldehyde dehydrogenase family protein [uncultured Maritimibacter sp.]